MAMKVVEKDRIVSGMLNDEYNRCLEMVAELERAASMLPKGSLQQRKKHYKGSEYYYYFLKYREGGQSISKHVAEKDVEAVKEGVALRKKYEQQIKGFKSRMAYLNQILGAST
jgi:hypothetical protein